MPAPDKTPASGRNGSAAPADAAQRRAWKTPAAVAIFVILTAATLAADLWSKHAAFNSLLNDPTLLADAEAEKLVRGDEATAEGALRHYRRPVAPGVWFSLSTNRGIAFGLPVLRTLVTTATALTIVLVCWFFATSPAGARLMHVALAAILGGALGNLYDRVLGEVAVSGYEPIRHQVRDFIDCSALHYPWVFNLADAWLVAGVGMLMIYWLRSGRPIANANADKQG